METAESIYRRFGSTDTATGLPVSEELLLHLGPVAVTSALRDSDDTIVDFRYDLVNPAFCEVVGESADTLLGRGLLELYPSHVELGLFDAYCAVVETGAPYISELPWFDERNVHAFLEVRVVRFRDGYLMTGRDITAAKMGEQVRRIFEQSRDGIVSIDRAMRISTWNAGAGHLYGLSEHEAVGTHISVITAPELRTRLVEHLTAVMATPDDVATFDAEGSRADGTPHRCRGVRQRNPRSERGGDRSVVDTPRTDLPSDARNHSSQRCPGRRRGLVPVDGQMGGRFPGGWHPTRRGGQGPTGDRPPCTPRGPATRPRPSGDRTPSAFLTGIDTTYP
ncbi:MAG: PAS domain-containing protein [Microthrixaceae bacterium]